MKLVLEKRWYYCRVNPRRWCSRAWWDRRWDLDLWRICTFWNTRISGGNWRACNRRLYTMKMFNWMGYSRAESFGKDFLKPCGGHLGMGKGDADMKF